MAPLLILLLVVVVAISLMPLLLRGRAAALRGLCLPLLLFWDKSKRSFVLAVRSLWLHKLRAFLSVLGIIIGTAAVIALMAFGEGSMLDALEDIARQGATNVIVRSVKPPDDASNQRRTFVVNYGLTHRDYKLFKKTITVAEHCVPMRVFPQEVRYLQHMINGRVVGTTAGYQDVNKFQMALGRFLIDADNGDDGPDMEEDDEDELVGDDRHMRNVAVLGAGIAEQLFPLTNPLGKTVVLNRHQYIVIGVIAERMPSGSTTSGQTAEEFNNDVYIPLRTCLGRFGERIFIRTSGSRSAEQVELHQITLKIKDMNMVRGAGNAVRDHLEQTHIKKDWRVTIPLDRLEEAQRARDRYTMLLVLIASISLLVGGIGIMNIMLATVTERTREIGIRRALGGKRRDITMQFLVEAMVQTSIGGMAGVLLGLALVFGIPFVAEKFFAANLPAKVHVLSIFLSLGVSIGVGVLFGWYPAHRASRLDPIEALRHE